MLHDIVKKGSTSRSVTMKIVDSTDGTPETGVVFNTSGIDLWYRRELSAKVSITEATLAALTTAWASGGFLHIGDGAYRLDLPDAAFATGANHVDFGGTVTGMIVIGGRVKLVNYDPEDTVRLGLTALPNAASGAANGLPVSTAGSLNLDTITAIAGYLDTEIAAILADTNELQTDWTNGGRLDLLIDAIKAKTDLIQVARLKKDAAFTGFPFFMTDSTTHAPATGATPTVTRSIAGATHAAGTLGAVTEIGLGWYKCDLGVGDTAGTYMLLRAQAASCDNTNVVIYLEP